MSFLSDVYFNSSAFASHHFISLVYCCRAPASLLCLILCSAEAVSPSQWYFNLLYENLPWSAILSYHGSRVLLLPMLSEAQLLLSRLNLVAFWLSFHRVWEPTRFPPISPSFWVLFLYDLPVRQSQFSPGKGRQPFLNPTAVLNQSPIEVDCTCGLVEEVLSDADQVGVVTKTHNRPKSSYYC